MADLTIVRRKVADVVIVTSQTVLLGLVFGMAIRADRIVNVVKIAFECARIIVVKRRQVISLFIQVVTSDATLVAIWHIANQVNMRHM